MGSAQSSSETYLSAFLLCGGGDAVDDKAIQRYAARQNTPRIMAAPHMPVHDSAKLFLREFKRMLKTGGFVVQKYSRTGRAAVRVLRLDPQESMLVWETKKTARIANGDRFDHLLLGDIAKIKLETRATNTDLLNGDATCLVSVEASERRLLLGFESETRSQMFADGMSLLLAGRSTSKMTTTTMTTTTTTTPPNPPPSWADGDVRANGLLRTSPPRPTASPLQPLTTQSTSSSPSRDVPLLLEKRCQTVAL